MLYGPDNSLVHQSYAPQLMQHIQNLAGFGLCAWSSLSPDPQQPFYYTTTQLPFFDKNLYSFYLKRLQQIASYPMSAASLIQSMKPCQNKTYIPSKWRVRRFILGHNGNLAQMPMMKLVLIDIIKPKFLAQIKGTTDSEWIYALFLSQIANTSQDITMDDASTALIRTLKILQEVREINNIRNPSPLNLFVTESGSGIWLFPPVCRELADHAIPPPQISPCHPAS